MNYMYYAPRSMPELLKLLAEKQAKTTILAGGTDVMVDIRAGHQTDHLIDITRITELKGIRREGDTIHIGPATTFTDLAESPILREGAFVLAQAASLVGSPLIRNRGTVGGNIVKGSPAADSVPALVALEAKLFLRSQTDEREMDIEDFLLGVCKTAIRPDEVLAGISFKALPAKTGSAFVKLGRRNALAISRVSVAAIIGYDETSMVCTDCRISVGAVSKNPFRVKSAEAAWQSCSLTQSNRDLCVQAALEEISRTLGERASAVYKKKAGPAIIRRAIDSALGQVFGGWEQVL